MQKLEEKGTKKKKIKTKKNPQSPKVALFP